MTGLVLEYCGLRSAGYDEEDVSFVSAVLATHAVTLGTAGRAFYPVFAFMSHSCTYNARHVIDAENTIRVYAQSPIKKENNQINKHEYIQNKGSDFMSEGKRTQEMI